MGMVWCGLRANSLEVRLLIVRMVLGGVVLRALSIRAHVYGAVWVKVKLTYRDDHFELVLGLRAPVPELVCMVVVWVKGKLTRG